MTLRDRLEADIQKAMRSRDQSRLDALRFLKSTVQLEEKTRGKSLDDPTMVDVIAKQIKDRRESIRMFEQGNRADLAAKESTELAILQEYLPPQLGQEELVQLVRDAIKDVGATSIRDKGKVMGRLMPQVRGKADGSQVNDLVTRLLESGGA